MNPVMSLNLPEYRPSPQITSDFYRHPYGGVARDIWVTGEQFARLFEIHPSDLERIEPNIKWFDVIEGSREILGYKIVVNRPKLKRTEYKITFIDYSPEAAWKHLGTMIDLAWKAFTDDDNENAFQVRN